MPGKIPLDDPHRGELFDATLDALTAKGFFDVKEEPSRERSKKMYNGWANYETWYFKLYLDDGSTDYLKERAREILREVDADESLDSVFTGNSDIYRRGRAIVMMAEELKELLDEIEQDAIEDPLILGLYDAARQRIDFNEVAGWYLDYCNDY